MRNPKTRHGVLAKAAATASALLLAGAMIVIAFGTIDGDPGDRVEGRQSLRGMPYGAAGAE